MKMASVSVVCVFLLCCLFANSATSQGCDHYAVMGRNISLPLGHTLKETDSLKWLYKEETLIYKRTEGFVTGEKHDINASGSLGLTNVKKNQAGPYTFEIYDKNGKSVARKIINLCVQDPVKKPIVKATCKEEKVKFECILGQQPKDVKHEWLQNGKTIKEKTFFERKAAETKADKFACKVSNEADSATSEVVIHDCHSCLIFECLLGFPDQIWWAIIGGGGGIVLLLIILVIFCCISSRRKRILRLKDEEELRLEWTNTEQHIHHQPLPPLPNNPPPHHQHHHQQQQQHHHHHHHQQQQQQAPGNTGPRQSRSKQNRQPRAKAPEPNGQPQPSPRRTVQAEKPANKTDDEQPPPLPQPRKKNPKKQVE